MMTRVMPTLYNRGKKENTDKIYEMIKYKLISGGGVNMYVWNFDKIHKNSKIQRDTRALLVPFFRTEENQRHARIK